MKQQNMFYVTLDFGLFSGFLFKRSELQCLPSYQEIEFDSLAKIGVKLSTILCNVPVCPNFGLLMLSL